ncbi:hypothetical protein [Intrasporangium sp. DVR]|uniref:hypothetical protein n=1 Tax=Intrasporangium sp. DVR TaxID=3127867 RepID=UPI00313A5A2C
MRRLLAFIAVFTASLLFAAPAALATSPHFVRAAGSINGDGSLTVSFKEAGLGTNQNINYTLSADASVTYVCVNKGGANPSASNKTTIAGPVSASGTFSSGKNGQVTASLTVDPPSPGDFSCPKGQTRQIASVSYSSVTLADATNGITENLGTFDSGCLLPRVRGAC